MIEILISVGFGCVIVLILNYFYREEYDRTCGGAFEHVFGTTYVNKSFFTKEEIYVMKKTGQFIQEEEIPREKGESEKKQVRRVLYYRKKETKKTRSV